MRVERGCPRLPCSPGEVRGLPLPSLPAASPLGLLRPTPLALLPPAAAVPAKRASGSPSLPAGRGSAAARRPVTCPPVPGRRAPGSSPRPGRARGAVRDPAFSPAPQPGVRIAGVSACAGCEREQRPVWGPLVALGSGTCVLAPLAVLRHGRLLRGGRAGELRACFYGFGLFFSEASSTQPVKVVTAGWWWFGKMLLTSQFVGEDR